MGLFQGFLNPALAAGALLAVVPLLIHLLNRQRHKPMEWAAMRFVEAAFRRTRRRSQFENLILLLLRMGAVALLAFAVARPFLGEESLLAPLTESRRDVVLVIDRSASTGYRESVSSVFERLLERARERLNELDGSRGDRVTLITADRAPSTLSSHGPEDAIAALSTLTSPSDHALDLAAALAEVVGLAERDAAGTQSSVLEVVVLTDLQRRTFTAPRGETAEAKLETPALLRALDRLEELGVRVRIEDLGAGALTPANLGLIGIETSDRLLGAGLESEVVVTVANHGPKVVTDARVVLEIDGQRLPTRPVEVPARGTASVQFPFTPRRTGEHVLEASLAGDRLTFDDTVALVVDVPAPVRVLLVDGAPSERLDKAETGYLGAVLEAPLDDSLGRTKYQPFDVRTLTVAGYTANEVDLNEVDVLVLANLVSLPPSSVERIEERVAAGGSVVFTVGDAIANARGLETFTTRFFAEDGTGLLPARPRRVFEVPERRDRFHRAATFDAEHPALEFFADERWVSYLTEVPVYGFLAVEPLADARVLAALDDAARSPLLIERPYDRGLTYLWTTSIDGDWTNLPELPASFVPLVHEWFRHAGRPAPRASTVALGRALSTEFARFPREAVLVLPSGDRRRIDAPPRDLGDGRWRLDLVDTTDQKGVWRLEQQAAPTQAFVVEADHSEGDLDRMEAAEIEAFHPALQLASFEPGTDVIEQDDASRGELWRWLAALALGALIAETLWSAWIGRKRSVVR
ncbi:MAG: BatA domain-containing protein [Planctomycetota bacterium]